MIAAIGLLLLAQVDTTEVDLRLLHFWRPPNITSIVGLVGIPLDGLTYTPEEGAGRVATYQVGIELRDDEGNVLRREDWSQRVRTGAGDPPESSQAYEHIELDLHPGRYDLLVSVTDSVSGSRVELQRVIQADTVRPVTGDLLLASTIRRVGEDTASLVGGVERNGMLIQPIPGGVVEDPTRGVDLYTEVYPPEPNDTLAQLSVVLRSLAEGGINQESPAGARRYPAGGGLELLHLPLDGLQPGDYRLGLRLQFPDTSVLVETDVHVLAPELGDEGLFAGWDEGALDSLFEVAGYLATNREKRLYPTLSTVGKRTFMDRFWESRDPTPGEPNEAFEEFSDRVEYANREFHLRGNPGQGWSSDRGRIYIMYGPPAERYVSPDRMRETPYEIWTYTGGRGDKYAFVDVSRWGNFSLVYTTNPDEPTLPNWRRYFSEEALRLIERSS